MIETPTSAAPRCTATVRLLSRVFRPFLFSVTVLGEPPHPYRVTYRIAAASDNDAAVKGMQLFTDEFLPWVIRRQVADIVPGAKLQ